MNASMNFADYLDWLTANQDFIKDRNQTKPVKRHPGSILRRDYLVPKNISQTELAKRCHCTHARINEIIHGKRGISPRFALELEQVFGIAAEYWLSLQIDFDLHRVRQSQQTREKN